MKALITIAAMILIPLCSFGNVNKDTITINFGNNSRIIIYVSNQQDLKALQQYDINKMLKDLHLSIDTTESDVAYLKIEDTTGTKYLKDTSLVYDYSYNLQFKPEGYQKELLVSGFSFVRVGYNFESLIKRGDEFKVILSGKEEDVEDVAATLRGNTLEFRYKSNINNRKNRVKIYIEMPELTGLNASGAAKVNVAGFESAYFESEVSGAARLQAVMVANEVRIEASGASKVKMIGKADRFYTNVSGAAEVNASEFEIRSAEVHVSGAAKAWINADELASNASGAGRIYNHKKSEETLIRSNFFRIRIGKYEFSVPTDGWEDFDRNFDHVESIDDLTEKVNKTEYVQKTTPRVRHSINFELGMNNYLENGRFPEADGAPYSVKPWGSWYVGAYSSHKFHLLGPLFLDWGKGINWYNFKFDNADMRVLRMENGVGFEEDPRGYASIKSKITASYLNMSLMPLFDFSHGLRKVKSYSMEGISFTQYNKRGFRFGAGGYAGYRIGSHTKYVFKDDRRRREKDRGSFYLNNWRYGVRGQVGFKALDLFFNYDLSPLYVGDGSPELQPFSFGVIF